MNDYWHSVILDKELCCGCTNCLDRCPTQAIRVIEGKARIINEGVQTAVSVLKFARIMQGCFNR